jgi:hypothetical protein
VLGEVSGKLDDAHELAPVVRRSLNHDGAATSLYFSETRSGLRPGAEEIQDRFENMFVKVDSGYVIRPTRRGMADRLSKLPFAQERNHASSRLVQPQRRRTGWSTQVLSRRSLGFSPTSTLVQHERKILPVTRGKLQASALTESRFGPASIEVCT